MKFLIDNALSPQLAAILRKAGLDAVHVRQLGLERADDEHILLLASKEGRTVVTADTDFGDLLALRGGTRPSVILFRGPSHRRPRRQGRLLLDSLERLREWILAGSIIVFDADRIRVRKLPVVRRRRED